MPKINLMRGLKLKKKTRVGPFGGEKGKANVHPLAIEMEQRLRTGQGRQTRVIQAEIDAAKKAGTFTRKDAMWLLAQSALAAKRR